MSTSSKPRWGDPVVKVSKDEFGEAVGIPTSQFQEFLDELETDVTAGNADLIQQISSILSQAGQFSAQRAKHQKYTKRTDQVIASLRSEIGRLTSLVGQLKVFKSAEIAVGETIIAQFGDTIITCNNTVAASVTLNPAPVDLERVIIKVKDAQVTLTGTVDGDIDPAIIFAQDGVSIVYTSASGEWKKV